MKKKQIIITLVILLILVSIIILYSSSGIYTVKVKTIDSFSPDRTLEVYKNNKKITYKEIRYDDNTTLCYSQNPTVAYTDIINVEELIIVLKNNKQVTAKIVEN